MFISVDCAWKRPMSDELDKLEACFKILGIKYTRYDINDRHQICVGGGTKEMWDVICQKGSYGYEDGLLELYGSLLTNEEREDLGVAGWLTAADVLKRYLNSK